MKLRLAVVAFALVVALVPASASAITGGVPDGTNHPYVGYLDNRRLCVFWDVALIHSDADSGPLL